MQFETNARGGWIVPAYTVIPDGTEIPTWSDLDESCVLGVDCKIGASCKIGARCTLGNSCKVGVGCTLGESCDLGALCTFGAGCTFGAHCSLGNSCALGAETQWLGVIVESWLTLANVDGSGRQIKIVKHAEGVLVEAGCFRGTLEDFCTRAASEGKDRYVRVISAVAAAM